MAKDEIKTTIDSDGLRYRSKPPVRRSARPVPSPRQRCPASCAASTPRASLKGRKLLGRTQFVCAPSCKELADQEKSKG
jgi:hypothetical protein